MRNQVPKTKRSFGLMLTQRPALNVSGLGIRARDYWTRSWRASTEPVLWFSLSSTACWCPDTLGWCWPALRRALASRRRCGPGRCSTVWPATSSGSSRAPCWLWPSSPWSWRGWRLIGSLSLPTCWGKHRSERIANLTAFGRLIC